MTSREDLFPLWSDLTDNSFFQLSSNVKSPADFDSYLTKSPIEHFIPMPQFTVRPKPDHNTSQLNATLYRAPIRIPGVTEEQLDTFASLYSSYLIDYAGGYPSDEEFERLMGDGRVRMNPRLLGFIPTSIWPDLDVTFGAIVKSFFQKRNVGSGRFSHKLFNALRIASVYPNLRRFLGVEWITDKVLRVDKRAFARLISVRIVDGSLFHKQGNFPSHGFVEVGRAQCWRLVPMERLSKVDFDAIRLFVHSEGMFTSESTDTDVENCKWFNVRKNQEG
jgi:hypothetical protein